MRAGWMRPSWISFSSARRATSRRTGSKLETVIASGVSSMIRSLDAADVAALAADDAALHLVVGERYDGDGDLAGVVGGAALDGGGNDLLGAVVGLLLELGLDLLDFEGHLMGDLVADVGDQVGLGLLDGEAGDLLQHLHLALLEHRDLLLLGVRSGDLRGQGLVLLVGGVELAVQVLLLLLKAALLLRQLGPALLDFPLILGAVLVYFFFCLNESFSLFALCTLYRVVDNALGFFLSADDLTLGDLFAVHHAEREAGRAQNKRQDDG